jgi:hypothetical protein
MATVVNLTNIVGVTDEEVLHTAINTSIIL